MLLVVNLHSWFPNYVDSEVRPNHKIWQYNKFLLISGGLVNIKDWRSVIEFVW